MRNIIDRIENSVLKVIVTGLLMIISGIIGMFTIIYVDQELMRKGKLSYEKGNMKMKI